MSPGGRVLVTGASRGIGLELARQHALAGDEVVATCRHPDAAAELSELEQSAAPGAVAVHRLDVTSGADLDELAAALGPAPLDVVWCNAAVLGGARSRLGDVDFDAWRGALEVNLLGAVRVALRLVPNVAAAPGGKIVFLGSRAGLPREATAGRSYVYTSSKAALHAAARCLALDLAPQGVTVVVCNPGHVRTGIGGAKAPMTPAESVTRLREVVARVTPADAGRFLHFDGTELPL